MVTWTEEQILGLAPDTFTIRAARGLANPEKWEMLGRNEQGAWGQLPNVRKKPPTQVMLLFEDMSLWCTCQATKAPCNHGLALMLMLATQSDIVEPDSPPNWFIAKQTRHQQQSQRKSKPEPHNLELLRSGMNALELWLKDMIRNGLADLPDRPQKYWSDMADRMIDAEAPLIAHKLKSLAKVPVKQKNWPEQYLQELGKLYLFAQGFKHWDQQQPETQADLKTAVGWLPTTPSKQHITDDWLVLGHGQEIFGRLRRKLIWLWGINTNRAITLMQPINPGEQTVYHYPTGLVLQGAIQLANGNWPTYGLSTAPLKIKKCKQKNPFGYASIRDAFQVYTNAKAVVPWLNAFPMLINRVKPLRIEGGWHFIDETGTILPFVDTVLYGWHLEAFSNGRFLPIFGIWNGTAFTPISVKTNHQWLNLRVLRGVR